MKLLAIFGPTGAGKTGVATALAALLRERGEDPVAVNCDSIQVYRGLGVLSGAATADERESLEHRLLGFVDVGEEFSAGRYAKLAHAEIDGLLRDGHRPIVVGGTGLYLRAALSDLDLRPSVPAELRGAVEREIDERGPEALHEDLDPEVAATVHPNDRKRVARALELQWAGIDPPTGSEQLWTARMRHEGLLVGLTIDRDELAERINHRVEQMARDGAAAEADVAQTVGASRTAGAAIGFEEFLAGDLEAVKAAHRRFARRQLTWMRKMSAAAEGSGTEVRLIDRTGRDDESVAAEVVSGLQ